MKIGILTFHAAFNYGSMLQAWALQTALTNLGHDVKVINFQSPRQKRMYRKPFGSINLKYILGDLNKVRKFGFQYLKGRNRWEKYNEFLHCNIHLTKEYDSESWYNEVKDFDIIITGSDQIWNLNAYDFDEAYLGKSIEDNVKLIAYAPSLGPSPEKNDLKIMKHYLMRYKSISTREEGGKRYILNNNIFPTVEKVLDPTMLLSIDNYLSFITDKATIAHPYAYYYTPGNHPQILDKAIDLCKSLGIPLKVDFGYFHSTFQSNEISILKDTGPCDFLSYIYHAKFVIGASFHLIVFAILMHKDFYCINGDVDERLNNLLSILNLKERILSLESQIPTNITPINWEAVDEKLRFYRDRSYQYLLRSVSV